MVASISGNNSTTALNSGAVFTGGWSKVDIGSLLHVTFTSDVTHSIAIQYSVNGGTNVDSTLTRYFSPNAIFPPEIFKNERAWVRLVVTNTSASNATYMRLVSHVSDGEPFLNIPVDATMAQNYGALSTRPTGFNEEVALGRRQGWTTWNKFGYNSDVDSGAAEVVAAFGGTFSRMTSADTLSIVSSSANDANGGTGVNSIVIYGIDENRDEVTAVYNMNGTTPVVTTGQNWLGVNRVAIFLFGSGGTNAGNITITATTATTTQAYIPAGDGVTQQMIFHVPRDHQFLATSLFFNVNKISGASPVVTLKGLVYSAVNGGIQEVWRETIDTSVVNDINVVPTEPFPISEKSILYFTATTSNDNTIVNGRFSGKLVRDVDA